MASPRRSRKAYILVSDFNEVEAFVMLAGWASLSGFMIWILTDNIGEFDIDVKLTIGPAYRTIEQQLLTLGLHDTVKMFWNGSAYILALGVAFGSGAVFPLTMFCIWMALLCPLSFKYRNFLVTIARWLVKWEMLAMFNFIITSAGMAYEVKELNGVVDATLIQRALRGGGNSLIILPFVLAGIYSVDHLHFRAESRRKHEWLPAKQITHLGSRIFVGLMAVIGMGMVLLLAVPPAPLLEFTRRGMLEDLAPKTTITKTLNAVEGISVVQYPPQPTGYTYFYAVFIFPVLDAIFMLWRAITKKESYRMRFLGCAASSLNGLEVFALVALANIRELYDFSTYVVNKQNIAQQVCDVIKEDLHTDECPDFYSSSAQWRDGCWVLLIGAGAFLAGHIVLWLAEKEESGKNDDLLRPLNEEYPSTADPNFQKAAARRNQREEEFID